MAQPIITLGAMTTHGGKVITASSLMLVDGKPVARMGDMVVCPKKGHGTCPIIEGDPLMIVDGKPVARHGHKTACGASLIANQFLSVISTGGVGG